VTPGRTTTKLSSKDQVIIPKPVRDAKGRREGEERVVETVPEGVLFRPAPDVSRTSIEGVAGCLRHRGPRRSLADMDEGVHRLARRSR
jgi:AbrB family looped-hinge helix DNA binding protein